MSHSNNPLFMFETLWWKFMIGINTPAYGIRLYVVKCNTFSAQKYTAPRSRIFCKSSCLLFALLDDFLRDVWWNFLVAVELHRACCAAL